ncbi:MAG: response regulator transcription factor [Actinobacteria bacterium]|jgi:DNA-binding response OmpR family regulator|nr:response regulator transcription factor [Actinomycetota bacterium]
MLTEPITQAGDAARARLQASQAQQPTDAATPPRVLVAEDDPDVRSLLRCVIEAEGYVVDAVADGHEALEHCRQRRVDLVVLDVMMPRLTGFEVVAHLRDEPATARIPVLIVSARGSESDIVSGFDLGVSDYVTKPFKIAELRARIRALLARQA